MLALYRGGRPADALGTYQRGRRLLVHELGLEPGESLRQLETRMLQQDPGLDRPNVPRSEQTPARPPPTHSRRLRTLGIAVLLVAAVIGGVLTAATAGHGQKPGRVALVVSAPQSLSDTSSTGIGAINGLRAAATQDSLGTKVLYGGYTLSGFLQEIRAAALSSDFVVVGATSNLDAVSKLTRQLPRTRFLITGSVADRRASFLGQKNVTGLNFNERENGYLGG
jgi:hypothetical protein